VEKLVPLLTVVDARAEVSRLSCNSLDLACTLKARDHVMTVVAREK